MLFHLKYGNDLLPYKQPCTHPLPKGNVQRPFNLPVMFLDYRRKLEYPERTHFCTGRTCRKTPGWDLNPGPFCCKAMVLPNAPPCSLNLESENETGSTEKLRLMKFFFLRRCMGLLELTIFWTLSGGKEE
ncbi:hypothetical protein XENOCAPTIV_006066 [Xenoophorus captivus]|uniref:Uncharacterized protein n=1 Tax=Xenoophorus captivus TaxID=1517983 RepID=A0ABV0SEC8_9TELE